MEHVRERRAAAVGGVVGQGWRASELARRFEVSRPTVYATIERWLESGGKQDWRIVRDVRCQTDDRLRPRSSRSCSTSRIGIRDGVPTSSCVCFRTRGSSCRRKRDATKPPQASSVAQQKYFDVFKREFNDVRPH